jgi:hypothetical protein
MWLDMASFPVELLFCLKNASHGLFVPCGPWVPHASPWTVGLGSCSRPAGRGSPSLAEERLRAVGKTSQDRYVFLVFTIREREGERLIRPISARYMHGKEVAHYEKEDPDL